MGINNPGGGGGSSSSPTVVTEQGAANFVTSQFDVPATAGGGIVANARPTRWAITITNLGTTPVYIGPTSAVTLANGQLLPGVVGASVTIPTISAVSAISSSGTQRVSVLETYS